MNLESSAQKGGFIPIVIHNSPLLCNFKPLYIYVKTRDFSVNK